MEDTAQIDSQPERRYYYVGGCCWPTGYFGTALWGGIIILLGSAWLLTNLDLIPASFDDIFWPLILIVIGLAFLASLTTRGRRWSSGYYQFGEDNDRKWD